MLARKMDAEDRDEVDEVDWEKQRYFVPKEGALESGMLDERPPSQARRKNWEPDMGHRRQRKSQSLEERLAQKEEKQAQKERNGGKTDAELAHEARNAANREKAAHTDPDRRKSREVPWFIQARQEKRAAKTTKNL